MSSTLIDFHFIIAKAAEESVVVALSAGSFSCNEKGIWSSSGGIINFSNILPSDDDNDTLNMTNFNSEIISAVN